MSAGAFFRELFVMETSSTDTIETKPRPSTADRITDAVRHAAHLSHKARLMTSLGRDAAEEKIYTVRRAIRRGVGALHDAQDEAALDVKRQPFKSLALAFGAGLQLGVLIAWLTGRQRGRADAQDRAKG